MHRYVAIPVLFFVIAAGIGLFLRWQFLIPTPGIRYTWFLHAHSHMMFLGWVLNVLYLAFLRYVPEPDRKAGLKWFAGLQVAVVGMLITFPLQGYALYSISFSTLHTLAVMWLIIVFYRRTRRQPSVALAFVRPGLLFFLISTAGPFALGYLMSQDLGHTVWYNFSIYYYLHFQYNGFFTFGVLALFYQMLEDKGVPFDQRRARRISLWLAIACVPAYALSVLFANPGLAFNVVGGLAALVQLAAVVSFSVDMRRCRQAIRASCSPAVWRILQIVWLAWVCKTLLQLISAHPYLARLAYELRPVTIAYLHLVLVGTITLFLMAWYLARGWAARKSGTWATSLVFVGFVLSEAVLVMVPWWGTLTGGIVSHTILVFVFSLPMFVGGCIFLVAAFRSRRSSGGAALPGS